MNANCVVILLCLIVQVQVETIRVCCCISMQIIHTNTYEEHKQ